MKNLKFKVLTLMFVVLLQVSWKASAQPEQPSRVACIGDSITYGFQVEDRDHKSYPAVLGRLLGDEFEVKNFGVSGTTLLRQGDEPYVKRDELKSAVEFAPQIVVIMLGTNDSKPQNWAHKAEFEADVTRMIIAFRALDSHPGVWLCLPARVTHDGAGISESVINNEIIPSLRHVAARQGVPVIDIHAAMENHDDFYVDGIHPNAAGADLIAQTVHDALLSQK